MHGILDPIGFISHGISPVILNHPAIGVPSFMETSKHDQVVCLPFPVMGDFNHSTTLHYHIVIYGIPNYQLIHLYRMSHEIKHPFWGKVVKTISISEIPKGSFLISQDFTELQEANVVEFGHETVEFMVIYPAW